MTTITGGVGCASPTSKDPAWRRGSAGPSSHTSFFGDFKTPVTKTHFTQQQHGRLELLEQDFVHGGAAYKRTSDIPADTADIFHDVSALRIHPPPPKLKALDVAPPAMGTQCKHPAIYGGFAAHSIDDHKVTAPHLLETEFMKKEQRAFDIRRELAHRHDASSACYQFRTRTPRGMKPHHLYNPRPPYDHVVGKNAGLLLGGESHGGSYGPPKHRDGTQKQSLEQHICPTPRGRHKRADLFEQNLHFRRDFWHPDAPGKMLLEAH